MCKKGFPLRVRPGNGRGDSKNRLCRERPGLHPVCGPEHTHSYSQCVFTRRFFYQKRGVRTSTAPADRDSAVRTRSRTLPVTTRTHAQIINLLISSLTPYATGARSRITRRAADDCRCDLLSTFTHHQIYLLIYSGNGLPVGLEPTRHGKRRRHPCHPLAAFGRSATGAKRNEPARRVSATGP